MGIALGRDHDHPQMMKEALSQYLAAAKHCIGPGVGLDFAAAVLLFAIIDAIGSLIVNQVEVDVGGRRLLVTKTKRFRVLNTKYFGQSLNDDQIERILNHAADRGFVKDVVIVGERHRPQRRRRGGLQIRQKRDEEQYQER